MPLIILVGTSEHHERVKPRMNMPLTALFLLVLLTCSCGLKANKVNTPVLFHSAYTASQYDADFSSYNAATDLQERRRIRNRISYQIMSEIEAFYYQYEERLFSRRAGLDIAMDAVQLGLGAGTVAGNGERTKTILGALLTGVTGLDLSIDKNLYQQQTAQALINSMRSGRDRVKAQILDHLTNDDDVLYPFARARVDLIQLLAAGTIKGGMQELSNTTSAAASAQSRAVAIASSSDLSMAREYRQSVASALREGGDKSKVIAFLKAMGVDVGNNASNEQLEKELRSLGQSVITDPGLRKKWEEESKKAGLIP